jgi:hypothetical protein
MTHTDRLKEIKRIAVEERRKRAEADVAPVIIAPTPDAAPGINYGAFRDKMCKWCSRTFQGTRPFCSPECAENMRFTCKTEVDANKRAALRQKRGPIRVTPHLGRDHSEGKIRAYLLQLPDCDFTAEDASLLWGTSLGYSRKLIAEMVEIGLVMRRKRRGWWIKTSRGRKG